MNKSCLVTGFEPFDGRPENASWIAAKAVTDPHFHAVKLPVVWGAPGEVLTPLVAQKTPEIVIAMGEGRPGWFDLEHRALNLRAEKPDNFGRLPDSQQIDALGPDVRFLSSNVSVLQKRLQTLGYPVRRSYDAGQYLCEETLYTLEQLREQHPGIRMALFCHLPPYGTEVTVNASRVRVDENLLSSYANHLVSTCIALKRPVIS